MIKEAVISDDQKYRYTLYREWTEDPFEEVRVLNFCMLNPSTADGLSDDPTIRKCIGFAKLNGFNAIRVVNLFAFRSTDPKGLQAEWMRDWGDPVGKMNDDYVRELPPEETVVAAWGSTFMNKEWVQSRVQKTIELLNRRLYCLRKTKDGHPGHPVMMGYGPLMNFDETPPKKGVLLHKITVFDRKAENGRKIDPNNHRNRQQISAGYGKQDLGANSFDLGIWASSNHERPVPVGGLPIRRTSGTDMSSD